MRGQDALAQFKRHFDYRLGQLAREWPAGTPHPLVDLDVDRSALYEDWNLKTIAVRSTSTFEQALRVPWPHAGEHVQRLLPLQLHVRLTRYVRRLPSLPTALRGS